MSSLTEVATSFQSVMLDHGLTPPDNLIGDSALHRFYVEGDRKGTLNGAYILHCDSKPSGWAMHYKTGVSFTWSASGKREPMTAAMKRQIDEATQQRQAEQAKAHQLAAEKARHIWQKSTLVTEARQHPYLVKKCIKPHGSRIYRDALVIPLIDESGTILNLQFIGVDGTKRFLSGGRKKGCFVTIGDPSEAILVCEGWATGASLHEATGHYVIVALDAGNLNPVGEVVRRQYPKAEIIIAGDNDESGIGQLKAREAALACGGKYILPILAGQDWNDALTLEVCNG